jgi:hypothetical protein
MEETITLEEVLNLAKRLSSVDKVRLIEHIAPEIERDLVAVQTAPRTSLRGVWQGIDITEEDIAQARREMWGSFPREDI